MTIGARGLTAIVTLALCLGGCTQQQMRFFGFSRKPEIAKVAAPPPAPTAPTAGPEDEPVPVAAPRVPVETETVAPPAAGRPGQRS
jgi:hypothetical protein